MKNSFNGKLYLGSLYLYLGYLGYLYSGLIAVNSEKVLT